MTQEQEIASVVVMSTDNDTRLDLGSWLGLPVSMRLTTLLTAVGMWPLLSLAARVFGQMSWPKALLVGSIATDWHWFFGFLHQYGHFLAAKLTGHPMERLELWGPLGTSVYPRDEGDLPPAVHRRRALGGPLVSGLLALIAGLFWVKKRPQGRATRFLTLWTFGNNLLLFCLGALTPLNHLTNFRLGFDTDGDTILRWWGRRRRK